jgi:hypothetical protein
MSTPTSELEAIRQRLDALERQNRRLRLVLLIVALAGMVLWLGQNGVGQAQPDRARQEKVVEANKVILRDAQGKERASLHADKDSVILRLRGADGKLRLSLGVSNRSGSHLAVRDENERARAALSYHAGRTYLYFWDENQQPRAFLDSRRGESWLGFADENVKKRLELGYTKKGPCLKLLDGNGKALVSLATGEGGPDCSFFDTFGRRRAQLGVDAQKAGLTFFGANESQKSVTGIDIVGKTLPAKP